MERRDENKNKGVVITERKLYIYTWNCGYRPDYMNDQIVNAPTAVLHFTFSYRQGMQVSPEKSLPIIAYYRIYILYFERMSFTLAIADNEVDWISQP